MCECYQSGGRFIAEDPECQIHGSTAQAAQRELANGCAGILREIDDLRAAHAAMRAALEQYANHLNWGEDSRGIRRVWLEPGSTSPEAYSGFEAAQVALRV